jgi:ubiquinone/menaquinone biosynthesis C-methylase UbiE
MTSEEQRLIIERYNERLTTLGETAQALGWRDSSQQNLRFRVLAEIGDCSGCSVLDIGCGFGDLLDYLTAHGAKDVSFTGTDLNPALIEVARKRHPVATFLATTDLSQFADGSFDYVFLSGLFNFRIEDNIGFMRETVRQSFRIARRGVAFNLLGSYVDFQEPHLFYHREQDVFDFAKSLTRFVTLRADYPLYEFTVYLHKPEMVAKA